MTAVEKTKAYTYARRQPELTPCFKVVQGSLNTFIAERSAEGRPLPAYVVKEFDAYLKCGILAYGFLRIVCKDCSEEKIVAFSCKKRGFCPSCCGKRMAEASNHLVENMLPLIPYRQFVISFPIPLRYWFQTNKKLYSRIHRIVIADIHSFYKDRALELGIKDPTPGTISFTQRWGSALNLNPHMHVLCADGVYTRLGGEAVFRNIKAITNDQVASLITSISQKVMKHLVKSGYLDKNGEIVQNPILDELFEENEMIREATTSSVAGKIAFGPNAGKWVRKIGSGFGYGEEIPLVKGSRCFSINGFSLHANTSINTHARDKLAKLIEYIARGPLSNKRLEITKSGNIRLQLKTRWSDGTSHLLFTPGEFIEKLQSLTSTFLLRQSFGG